MIFPYGATNIPGARTPIVTWALIAVNVLLFAFEVSLSSEGLRHFIFGYGYIPAGGLVQTTLVSSIFLHGGWLHLIGNMLFLYLFGDNIEQTVGRGAYLLFYLVGGVLAGLAHYLSSPTSLVPAIGASGAIAAVMGAYVVLFPRSQIKLLFFYFPFRVSALLFLGVWLLQQLISGTASLGVATEDTAGVAWWAHIGGFVFGVLFGLYHRSRRPQPPPLHPRRLVHEA